MIVEALIETVTIYADRLSVTVTGASPPWSGGENVASKEVEECLFQHPAVAEVAVFGISDPHWIEAVVACVVLRTDQTATDDELVRFARDRLAGYKTPKQTFGVDSLPKNPSGKILKRDLRQQFGPRASA